MEYMDKKDGDLALGLGPKGLDPGCRGKPEGNQHSHGLWPRSNYPVDAEKSVPEIGLRWSQTARAHMCLAETKKLIFSERR